MNEPIRIFVDTEFTSLHDDAKLISIGLIDESGTRTFYAELLDTWKPDDLSDFAKAEVVPLLDGGLSRLTLPQLSQRVGEWLSAFTVPVVLATDSLKWDWAWVQSIFQKQDSWPRNLETSPILLTMNYLNDFDAFEEALEKAFEDGLRRHHALDDANANRIGWAAAGGDTLRTWKHQFSDRYPIVRDVPKEGNMLLHLGALFVQEFRRTWSMYWSPLVKLSKFVKKVLANVRYP